MIELLQFAGALAALIIIHELGHFFAAKMFGVEVEEFGLGFPPRILTLFTAGGTRFSLNLIPLGGFVRPKGENDPSVPGGLAAASPWVRLAVLSAGPLANLAVGVILYALIFTRVGMPITDRVQVVEVVENSPAGQAGLLPGDLIVRVNEEEINSMQELQSEIQANLEQPTLLAFERDGQIHEGTLVPRREPPPNQGAIGIVMGNPTRSISIAAAIPLGIQAVGDHATQLLAFPVRMIRGQTSPEEGRLVGLKGMFDIYQEVSQDDPTATIPAGVTVMSFFAAITISLGVLNLLPIPALDGGRIMFVLPEILLRRRIPPQYENVINIVSFALLLMLLLYVNLQDFINPISLP
jgi:regulator of sigma E protease